MVCKRRRMSYDHTRALHPDLVCEILRRVPGIDRLRNVSLVSLRFSQACRDPALWPHLRVQITDFQTDARWSSFLRWLVPRASGLQTLHFNNEKDDEYIVGGGAAWAPRVQDLMAVLKVRAPQLRSLVLRYPSSAKENATEVPPAYSPHADLGHLSQLTSLTLELGQAPIQMAPLVTLLRGLPALQHLGYIYMHCAWEECLVSIATSCPQLTCLQLGAGIFGECGHRDPLNAPEEIGLLTNLVELTTDNLYLDSLPDSISKLTSLQRLCIDDVGISAKLPSGLTACQQLSQLSIPSDTACPVLADLQSLQQLEITDCSGSLSEMSWPRLTGLTELKLVGLYMLIDEDILNGLVGMTGLRKLSLALAADELLPEGPYLNALESLHLHSCKYFLGLPSNIAAATKVHHIELTGYNLVYERPDLFFGMLDPLRALETLDLSDIRGANRLTWDDASREYRSRCLAQGRRPVAITHSWMNWVAL